LVGIISEKFHINSFELILKKRSQIWKYI